MIASPGRVPEARSSAEVHRKTHSEKSPLQINGSMNGMPMATPGTAESSWYRERVLDALCIGIWIFMSATMVFYNKFLLSYFGFRFPIALTMWHMVCCAAIAAGLINLGFAKQIDIPEDMYYRKVVPVAACYAGALWTSNEGIALVSVSFAQMVKAGLPVMVFLAGLAFGVETYRFILLVDIVLITTGVCISAYGEVDLVLLGLIMLCVSMVFDATRLILTQQIIQDTHVRFNPITTLYYIAPIAALFLSVPFCFLEAKAVLVFLASSSGVWHLALNGLNAFGLNFAVYLLIGRTSALTMNVSGLIKDWFTISGSVVFLGSVVTLQNLIGYSIAFIGVVWYNYLRLSHPSAAAAHHENAYEGGQGGEKGSSGGVSIEVVATSAEGGGMVWWGGTTGQAAHSRAGVTLEHSPSPPLHLLTSRPPP